MGKGNPWLGSISPSCKEKLSSISDHFQNCYANTEEVLVKFILFPNDWGIQTIFLNKVSTSPKIRKYAAMNYNLEKKNA